MVLRGLVTELEKTVVLTFDESVLDSRDGMAARQFLVDPSVRWPE
jgi:hypothetical protein